MTLQKSILEVPAEGFDWDSGNSFKIERKHGISKQVIESFFAGRVWVAPDLKHSTAEDRFVAFGDGPGARPMIVVFTLRTSGRRSLIRPISARFMHAKEARAYEQTITQTKK
jgi:hypothetical protein